MGIQLDWQIESDNSRQQATENPKTKRLRRKQRRNLAAVMFVIALSIGGIVGFVLWRLESFEYNLREDLLATVEVEVTALRVGDYNNFMSVQRSGSQEWLASQEALFYEYQDLKSKGEIQYTGKVIDYEIDIDESRARVLIEENINGVIYHQVWFYWLYSDDNIEQSGWRHVPQDEEFWGEKHDIKRTTLNITYHDLDENLAQALAPRLDQWWNSGCVWLGCPISLSPLEVEIVSKPLEKPQWAPNNIWSLNIPSPYTQGRVPSSEIIPPQLEKQIVEMIAARMMEHRFGNRFTTQNGSTADAEWLYSEYERWLMGRFLNTNGSPFLEGLVFLQGEGVLAQLSDALTPASSIGIIQSVTGTSMPLMSIDRLALMDWKGYFEWRLAREQQAILNDEQGLFFSFYDEYDQNAQAAANIRRSNPSLAKETLYVNNVAFGQDAQGNLLAYVEVLPNNQNLTIINFRWIEPTWKRIN